MTVFIRNRVVLGLFAWLLIFTPAAAEDPMGIEEILEESGVLLSFRGIPKSFEDVVDELAPVSSDPNFKEDFLIVLRQVFDAADMINECIGIFRERFPSELQVPITQFMRSPLGQRIIEVEVFAADLANSKLIESVGNKILLTLENDDPERLLLYEQIANDLGVFEHFEAIALNLSYAMLAGVFASGKGPVTIPHDHIQGMLNVGRDEMREELQKTIMSSFAFTYRDFNLDELSEYREVLKSDAGRKFNEVLFIAIDKILSERALEFGERLADQRNSRKT